MARKYELINDLYDQIIVDVTKDARAWQSFLRTACRNYKLRFDEQLLLFAQRPDANGGIRNRTLEHSIRQMGQQRCKRHRSI